MPSFDCLYYDLRKNSSEKALFPFIDGHLQMMRGFSAFICHKSGGFLYSDAKKRWVPLFFSLIKRAVYMKTDVACSQVACNFIYLKQLHFFLYSENEKKRWRQTTTETLGKQQIMNPPGNLEHTIYWPTAFHNYDSPIKTVHTTTAQPLLQHHPQS